MEILEDAIMVGTGAGIFYFSLFFLLVSEEGKNIRKTWLYPNLILFAVFLNPVIAKYILNPILNYGLPRLNMCFPVIFLVAYVITVLWTKQKGKEFWIAGLGIVLLLGMSWDNINTDLAWKQNAYGISPEIVEISDSMLEETKEPLILTANPDFNWFRQYSHDIHILYGENVTAFKMQGTLYHDIPKEYFELSEYMEQDVVDWGQITPLAEKYGVDYIVINTENHELTNDETDSGYYLWKEIGSYMIYANK